jgi:hypothetical protein
MIAVGAAAVVSSLGFEFSSEGVAACVAMVILSLAIVCGQGLAGFMCRRKYSGVRYSLWTALWEIVIIAVPIAVFGYDSKQKHFASVRSFGRRGNGCGPFGSGCIWSEFAVFDTFAAKSFLAGAFFCVGAGSQAGTF